MADPCFVAPNGDPSWAAIHDALKRFRPWIKRAYPGDPDEIVQRAAIKVWLRHCREPRDITLWDLRNATIQEIKDAWRRDARLRRNHERLAAHAATSFSNEIRLFFGLAEFAAMVASEVQKIPKGYAEECRRLGAPLEPAALGQVRDAVDGLLVGNDEPYKALEERRRRTVRERFKKAIQQSAVVILTVIGLLIGGARRVWAARPRLKELTGTSATGWTLSLIVPVVVPWDQPPAAANEITGPQRVLSASMRSRSDEVVGATTTSPLHTPVPERRKESLASVAPVPPRAYGPIEALLRGRVEFGVGSPVPLDMKVGAGLAQYGESGFLMAWGERYGAESTGRCDLHASDTEFILGCQEIDARRQPGGGWEFVFVGIAVDTMCGILSGNVWTRASDGTPERFRRAQTTLSRGSRKPPCNLVLMRTPDDKVFDLDAWAIRNRLCGATSDMACDRTWLLPPSTNPDAPHFAPGEGFEYGE